MKRIYFSFLFLCFVISIKAQQSSCTLLEDIDVNFMPLSANDQCYGSIDFSFESSEDLDLEVLSSNVNVSINSKNYNSPTYFYAISGEYGATISSQNLVIELRDKNSGCTVTLSQEVPACEYVCTMYKNNSKTIDLLHCSGIEKNGVIHDKYKLTLLETYKGRQYEYSIDGGNTFNALVEFLPFSDYGFGVTSAYGLQSYEFLYPRPTEQKQEEIIVRDVDDSSCTRTFTFTPELCVEEETPELVINEIMADPNGIDTNMDGVLHSLEDQFIELYNTTNSNLDISGWIIEIDGVMRHVFDEGIVIPKNTFITVFGGGNPVGTIPDYTNVSSTGVLLLNKNGSHVKVIQNNQTAQFKFSSKINTTVIDSHLYGVEGGEGESLARNPDFIGDFVKSSTIKGLLSSVGVVNGEASLPVEFTSFNAEDKDNYRLLRWSTASEINNERFEIEISENGTDYRTVGVVKGTGTSSVENTYSFEDKTLVYGPVVYYRLKQIDFDGAYVYSEVVTVELSNNEVVVYPNPTTSVLTVKGSGNFRVYDLFGREVENLTNTNAIYQLNTSNYEKGTYILRFENGKSTKFFKM